MNGITWNKAFSLFPRATFVERVGLGNASVWPMTATVKRKYRRRGFRLIFSQLVTGRELRGPFHLGFRYLGDPETMVQPLNTAGIVAPTFGSTLEGNSFSLSHIVDVSNVLKGGQSRLTYRWSAPAAVELTHESLRFAYVGAPYFEDFLNAVFSRMAATTREDELFNTWQVVLHGKTQNIRTFVHNYLAHSS